MVSGTWKSNTSVFAPAVSKIAAYWRRPWLGPVPRSFISAAWPVTAARSDRTPVPRFAEYVPAVSTAVTDGTRKA